MGCHGGRDQVPLPNRLVRVVPAPAAVLLGYSGGGGLSYINEGGDVVRDLRADIAAEAGARQTYESLINVAPDEGSKKALVHLLTREISHTHMFMKALESLGKLTDPLFGNVQPDKTVNLYFHLSSDGKEQRGPWNEAPSSTSRTQFTRNLERK